MPKLAVWRTGFNYNKGAENMKKMRDLTRIDPILSRLRRVWMKNDQLRLGQIISNASNQKDIFYIEDEDLIQNIEVMHQ